MSVAVFWGLCISVLQRIERHPSSSVLHLVRDQRVLLAFLWLASEDELTLVGCSAGQSAIRASSERRLSRIISGYN